MGSFVPIAAFAMALLVVIIVYQIFLAPFTNESTRCKWVFFCRDSSVSRLYVLHTGNWLIPQSETMEDGDDRLLLSVPLTAYLLNTTAGYVIIGGTAEPQPILPDASAPYPLAFRSSVNSSLAFLLSTLEVSVEEIRHVLLWSMESDVTGSLKDFPNATFYAPLREFAFAQGKNITSRYRPADYMPYLNRFELLDDYDKEPKKWRVARGIELIPTPGSTPGHMSFGITLTDTRNMIIVGGLSFSAEAITDRTPRPDVLDRDEAISSLKTLSKYMAEKHMTTLVPHDPSLIPDTPHLPEFYD